MKKCKHLFNAFEGCCSNCGINRSEVEFLHKKKIKNKLYFIYELWNKYRKDPKTLYNKKPPMGVIFSVEGFWYWLMKNYINNTKEEKINFIPRNFGKNTLVTNNFLSQCDKNESVEFRHPKYIAMSYKRLKEIKVETRNDFRKKIEFKWTDMVDINKVFNNLFITKKENL